MSRRSRKYTESFDEINIIKIKALLRFNRLFSKKKSLPFLEKNILKIYIEYTNAFYVNVEDF